MANWMHFFSAASVEGAESHLLLPAYTNSWAPVLTAWAIFTSLSLSVHCCCLQELDFASIKIMLNKALDRMTRSAVSRVFQVERQWRAPRHRSALR